MNQDKEIDALFSSLTTEFPDNDRFLARLSEKLDKVEYIKRIQEEQKRRYRTGMALAFVSGAVGMIAAFILFPLLPSDTQIIGNVLHSVAGLTLPGNAKILSILMTVILSYGLVFSAHSILKDIRRTDGQI